MPKMIRTASFTGGEADVVTWKRTDIEEYLTAAQSLYNCEVGTTGLARKRKGTVFNYNATSQAEQNSTLYEFIDKNGVYYIIMASDSMFYIIQPPNTFIQAVPVDYVSADLFSLDYTQDNDTLIITSPNYPPARLYVSNYSPLTFAWAYLDIYPLPAYDFNQINYNATTVALSASGTGLSGETLTAVFTNMPYGAGIPIYADGSGNSAWIGGQIVGGGQSEFAPIGYAIIQTVNQSTTTVTFTALIQVAFQITGSSTVGSQYSIRQPAWVPYDPMQGYDPWGLGYPSKVLYYQNRLWFANTTLLPITLFGSKLNQPISFDVGTGKDTDAIIYTIGQSDAVEIQWMNGGKQLEIFTNNYEFVAPQNEEVGLTPSTFSIRQQSSYGSSTIFKPQTYLNDSYFVQKTGKSAINFRFTGVGLSYQSSNISPQSQHLMKNPTNRALLRGTDTSQDNFIYLLNNVDNTLTCFQFATEIKLSALTPIYFEDNVQLIDIVTVNNTVYLLKYYVLTQTYTIEALQENVYIDSSQDYLMALDGTITQLDRFNGYKVQVIYQNQDFGQYDVENGTIQVTPLPVPYTVPSTVQVGLLYDVEIKPMYPFYSATSSPFFKQLSRIYIDYYQSLNFFINGKLVKYQNFNEIQLGLPLTPRTGTEIFSPVSGYDRSDSEAIVITQSSPYDLQILAIGYEIDMAVI